MRNNWNYTIHILWLMHTYVFCSYPNTFTVLHKTHKTFYFMAWYTNILPMLCPFCLMMSKVWRVKELWVMLCHIFPYLYIIIFSVSDRPTQGSNTASKKYVRAPRSWVFPRTPLLSVCVWSKFWLEWKVWLWKLVVPMCIHS